MVKLGLMAALLPVACVAAGLYGVLHNQISYTASAEYFEELWFPRFGIPPEHWDRVGAGMVGWRGSWWMGYYIAPAILLFGLRIPGPRAYLLHCTAAFGVAAATAMAVGVLALMYAHVSGGDGRYDELWLADPAGFARANAMHSAAYAGGFIGILTGIAYVLKVNVPKSEGVAFPVRHDDAGQGA